MRHLLDTNIFITAKNQYYGFSFCPGFWDWLLVAHASGLVGSIQPVRDELLRGDEEELTDWVQAAPQTFFAPLDLDVQASMRVVAAWVTARDYQPAAKQEFLGSADYLLLSHAHATGSAVVTLEVSSGSLKRVKVPDVCRGLAIAHMNTFQLLAKGKPRFVLA